MGRYFHVCDMSTREHAYLGKGLGDLFAACIDLGDWLPVFVAWQGRELPCPRLSPEAVQIRYEARVLEACDRPWLLEDMSELEDDALYRFATARAGHDLVLTCDDFLRDGELALGWPCDEPSSQGSGVGLEPQDPARRFPAPWQDPDMPNKYAQGWTKMPNPWARP